MSNSVKWLLAVLVALLFFLTGYFIGLLIELMIDSGKWFFAPLAIIVFVLAVIVSRHHVVK